MNRQDKIRHLTQLGLVLPEKLENLVIRLKEAGVSEDERIRNACANAQISIAALKLLTVLRACKLDKEPDLRDRIAALEERLTSQS